MIVSIRKETDLAVKDKRKRALKRALIHIMRLITSKEFDAAACWFSTKYLQELFEGHAELLTMEFAAMKTLFTIVTSNMSHYHNNVFVITKKIYTLTELSVII